MSIQIGQPIPEVTIKRLHAGIETLDTEALFRGKHVVLFGVPGAFTPTCSERHLPDFVAHFDDFRRRGIEVYCMAVNDPFVMQAWAREQQVPEGLQMLADGNGDLTRALGLQMDAGSAGMGQRCRRFSLYAEDGVVRALFVDQPGEFRVSDASTLLEHLPR